MIIKRLLSSGPINPIKQINPPNPLSKVYVLHLQNNKYYVGSSVNHKERINEHFENKGPKWTQIYKPEKVRRPLSEPQWELWELTETLRQMNIHGIDNVRGSLFSDSEPFTNIEKVMAGQLFNELIGSCRRCGGSGHHDEQCLSGSGLASWVNNFGGSLHFDNKCNNCGISLHLKNDNYCERCFTIENRIHSS